MQLLTTETTIGYELNATVTQAAVTLNGPQWGQMTGCQLGCT